MAACKRKPEHRCDLYDGDLYANYRRRFDLDSDWSRLTLTTWSDGGQAFKSSKKALWPLLFVINEFGPQDRHKFEHVIFGGFYLHDRQPHFPSYLAPLIEQLESIAKGFKVVLRNGTEKEVRAYLLLILADLPAKIKILGVYSFNHNSGGCNNCDQKPIRLSEFKKGVYPYVTNNIKLFKSDKDIVQCHRKFESPFASLSYFDTVHSAAVDGMHALFLNCAKKFATCWFETKKNHTL